MITKPTNTPKNAGHSSRHLLSRHIFKSVCNRWGTVQSRQKLPSLATFWAQKGPKSLQEQLTHTTFYLISNYDELADKHSFPMSPFSGAPYIQIGHKQQLCACTRTTHVLGMRDMHSLALATPGHGAARPCLARLNAALATLSRALSAGVPHLRHASPTQSLRTHSMR